MELTISSDFLGSKQNLIFNLDDLSWSWDESIPPDSWVLGPNKNSNKKNIDLLYRYYKEDAPVIYPANHMKAFKALCGENIPKKIPWDKALQDSIFFSKLGEISASAKKLLEKSRLDPYIETLTKENEFLSLFTPAAIDEKKWSKYYAEEKEKGGYCVSTFRPKNGFAKPTVYDQFGTITGRLTVSEGPNILTLSAKYRDMIVVEKKGNYVVSIDFVSLEPRFLKMICSSSSERIPVDLYEHIRQTVFPTVDIDRKDVKLLTLSVLYGASAKNLEFSFKRKKVDVYKLMGKIKEYFHVDATQKKLQKEFRATNYISNHFGRRIKSDNRKLLNHFVQSSAADVSLLGFCKLTTQMGKGFKPKFLIHDALIAELEDVEMLSKIESITIDGLGDFPIKIEGIS